MDHLQSEVPMDLVCSDLLNLNPNTIGRGNVLVVTDHLICYAQSFPMRDQQVAIVTRVLVKKLFVHYGLL